jgi:circadian clock protein KaiB
MTPPSPPESEPRAALPRSPEPFILLLYVAGMNVRSTQAVANIRSLCEKHLPGEYALEVINLYEHPAAARSEQIVAAPTCIRQRPLPVRRVIGDMSNTARVLSGLDLTAKS